jgi:hypothetical protein
MTQFVNTCRVIGANCTVADTIAEPSGPSISTARFSARIAPRPVHSPAPNIAGLLMESFIFIAAHFWTNDRLC